LFLLRKNKQGVSLACFYAVKTKEAQASVWWPLQAKDNGLG